MRSWDGEVAFAERQMTNPTQSWRGLCQSFSRQSVGAEAWASTALGAWNATPGANRIYAHPDSSSSGIAYFGDRFPGHAVPLDGLMAWSNDILRPGMIDYVHWDVFIRAWGLPYLGRIMMTPSGMSPTKDVAPPVPVTPPTGKFDPKMEDDVLLLLNGRSKNRAVFGDRILGITAEFADALKKAGYPQVPIGDADLATLQSSLIAEGSATPTPAP